MSQALTLARPYARAAFAIARAGNALPAWSDALVLAARIAADPQVAALLGNPRLTQADAVAEGQRQRAMAEAEIEAAANRAKEDLRKQVSALAVSGAEKLLKREIDANAHKALIDDLAAQL